MIYLYHQNERGEYTMAKRYRVTVNTDSYKLGRCSKKNWEAGTRNDYMLAINGRTFCENNLREVRWFLELFQGQSFCHAEWTPENADKKGKYGDYYGMSERYYKWLHKKGHIVKYHDRLCDLNRTQFLSGYGFCQGYFLREPVIDELKTKGVVKIPFKWLYDSRQYDNAMNGCYVKIEAVA